MGNVNQPITTDENSLKCASTSLPQTELSNSPENDEGYSTARASDAITSMSNMNAEDDDDDDIQVHDHTDSNEEYFNKFLKYVDEIRNLEAKEKESLEELENNKNELKQLNLTLSNKIKEIDEANEKYLIETEEKWKTKFSEDLNKLSLQKDNELSSRVVFLHGTLFREHKLMYREDILMQSVVAFEKALKEEQSIWLENHSNIIRSAIRISSQEHEKVHRDIMDKFQLEYQELKDKLRQNKKKRTSGGGILSWLSPSPKKAKDNNNDKDNSSSDNSDDDDSADDDDDNDVESSSSS